MNCHNCKSKILDIFYTEPTLSGIWNIYCVDCYQKCVVDIHGNIVPNPIKVGIKCECGSSGGIGQNHSNWCQFFRSEF